MQELRELRLIRSSRLAKAVSLLRSSSNSRCWARMNALGVCGKHPQKEGFPQVKADCLLSPFSPQLRRLDETLLGSS